MNTLVISSINTDQHGNLLIVAFPHDTFAISESDQVVEINVENPRYDGQIEELRKFTDIDLDQTSESKIILCHDWNGTLICIAGRVHRKVRWYRPDEIVKLVAQLEQIQKSTSKERYKMDRHIRDCIALGEELLKRAELRQKAGKPSHADGYLSDLLNKLREQPGAST